MIADILLILSCVGCIILAIAAAWNAMRYRRGVRIHGVQYNDWWTDK